MRLSFLLFGRLRCKLKLSPRLLRLVYLFFDVEAFGYVAKPDGRIVEYSFVIGRLGQRKAGRVLDVGCTARLNYLPAALACLGWEVYGIDIRRFWFKHPNFSFISGDIKRAPFRNNFFDHVYAVSTIEHIGVAGRYGIVRNDLEGDVEALKEISRILRPKGTLLITLPYGKSKHVESLGKVYDESGVAKLFSGRYKYLSELYYAEDSRGYIVPVPKDMVKESPSNKPTLALFELSPIKVEE